MPTPTSGAIDPPGAPSGARPVVTALAVGLLYVAALAVLGPSLRLSQWDINPANNQAAAEAMAWLDSRLDLPSRGGDTALFQGRAYNVFPPLLTILCYGIYGLQGALLGDRAVIPPIVAAFLIAAPLPLLLYSALRRAGAGREWAAVLAFYALAGTCLWPVAAHCRNGWIYSFQHVLAQAGLAILLFDLLGRRTYWLAGIGVLIAAWSRQTCILYAVPVLICAWRDHSRRSPLIFALIPIAVAAGVPAALNWLKFGSPLETGYRFIFEDQQGGFADSLRGTDGRIHVFGFQYVAAHAYYTWLSPPWFEWSIDGLTITGSGRGTGLFYGSPLLAGVVLLIRRWVRDPARLALMIASIAVMLVGLAWHGPTEGSVGYCRYTLDFAVVWLAVVAPWTDGPKRRVWSLGCLGWSVFYFHMVTPAGGF